MQILTVPSAKTCATRTHNAEIVLLQSRINSRASPARIYDHRDRERLQINFKLGSPLITTKIQNWETLTTTRPKSTRGISEKLNYISPAGRFQECPHCRQRRSNAPQSNTNSISLQRDASEKTRVGLFKWTNAEYVMFHYEI